MQPHSPKEKINHVVPFWSYDQAAICRVTKSATSGLSAEEAAERLRAIPAARKARVWQKDLRLFFRQFKSALVLMLVAAVLLSLFIGEQQDAIIILIILLATGSLSFFQERNAGRTVEKLQELVAVRCCVIRDEKKLETATANVVPGDVLYVKAGDIIPADCYVIESNELHVTEAGLTGESFPVRKTQGIAEENTALAKRFNCLWQGSSVVSGTGKAVVVQTGNNTVFGGISKSVSSITETSFEKGIRHFGFFLMKVTLVLVVVILVVNLLFDRPLMESVLFALALAVGMTPELLPAISTIAMSAGAKRMSHRKVIVKKLSAIQNLGEVNLLCTDKTGTITQGSIEIAHFYNVQGKEDDFVREIAFINASFETGYGNPIDEALKKLPVSISEKVSRVAEIPYDFIRKRLTIAVNTGNDILIITKGAFNNIVEICTSIRKGNQNNEPISPYLAQIESMYEDLGKEGYRVLGICYKSGVKTDITKDDEKEMTFAGFILLQDPLKEGLSESLESLRKLHIGLKIITGDNRIVAESIGKKIGLLNPVVLAGPELLQTSSEALVQRAKETDIFAEVEPYQKERIIRALRKNFTVAYMGDGINDVAAINAADVGISTDNAVDVAKTAADFVLLEKDLGVLAEGIKEGRKTFINTLKYIYITTGATFGNMFSVACASLILPFLPMLPAQILLTNFLTDLPFLAVSMDKVDDEELQRSGKWNIRLIRNYMVIFGLHSSFFDLLTFISLYWIIRVSEGAFQTGWFMESVMTELIILFIMRTKKPFLKSRPGPLLLWLSVAAVLITIALPWLPNASIFQMSQPGSIVLIAIFVIIILYTITADFLKIWFFRRMSRSIA